MDFDGLRARARRGSTRGELRLRGARHAGAVAARARDPQRAAVRVPRRCAARGAADAGGADARAASEPASADDLGALDAGGDRARARRSAARSARRRRAARRAADRRLPRPTAELARSAPAAGSTAGRRAAAPTRTALPATVAGARDAGRRRAAAGAARRSTRTRPSTRRSSARRRAPRARGRATTAIVELLRGRLTIVGPTTADGARRVARRSTTRTPTRRCWRSKPKASSCAAASRRLLTTRPSRTRRARVVRPRGCSRASIATR